MTAMGCETFSLADFTLKQTTFEPFHEDTQFSASDENPLVAYKVRVNFEGNLPLPESECKWTHVGFCYDRPYVEWIHGSFTGNFNADGAPIVTVEWAAAGPLSSTVYDLWRNGKYEIYDISGNSITFAIGGHPDSTNVTHEFGVRAVNLPDGCLSDLVTCTVTVPGDVTTCPPQPGDILLMSSIVGPVYDENNELVGIKVQLVWSGETESFIKIHRSFEECDQESPVIDTVSATQSCYYDTLQSGQIAYYYVESGRNNCPKVGESDCLTVSVLPQTGLNEGTVYFYVKDHLGNTRLVLDGEGNIQSRMSYEPYGVELYPLAANASGEKYKFTNQERDYTTGLDYFHARYYSSAMGRFMGADKMGGQIGFPQSFNKYAYTGNNPVLFFDSNGLWKDSGHSTLTMVAALCTGYSFSQASAMARGAARGDAGRLDPLAAYLKGDSKTLQEKHAFAKSGEIESVAKSRVAAQAQLEVTAAGNNLGAVGLALHPPEDSGTHSRFEHDHRNQETVPDITSESVSRFVDSGNIAAGLLGGSLTADQQSALSIFGQYDVTLAGDVANNTLLVGVPDVNVFNNSASMQSDIQGALAALPIPSDVNIVVSQSNSIDYK